MKKLKSVLLLLLTAALLLGCAVLPRAAAWAQDRMAVKEPGYGDLQPLQLDINSGTEETEPVSHIFEALSIMQNAYMFPLTEDAMNMTAEQVEAVVLEQLQPYIAMGLLPETEYSYFGVEPTIAMSVDELGSYRAFWSVHLVHEADPYESVFVHLDDETGLILKIQYEGYSQTFEKEVQFAMLEEMAAVFLEGLHIEEHLAVLDDPVANMEIIELADFFNDSKAVRCVLDTREYGIILIEFYLHENLFYTTFPTSPD